MAADTIARVPLSHRSSSTSGPDSGAPSPNSSRSSVSAPGDVTPPTVADPTVIVGMACRVPGAANPSELWKVLAEKKDLRRKMPENRFNVDSFYHPQGSNKGTTNARYGYFLDQGLDQFDAQFFNISGKEAEAMDPQQRILLEVVYEALENAGITLEEINGSQTGVWCGSFTNDYNWMTTKDLAQYPKYSITGTGNAILSNRISFYYNLHGPSMTIDTACSSSLVCFHLANQSVQNGESEFAIVCGSALHFDPNIFITMTDFGMLSVDGRCRSFDADGSGYVRGDGVCAVILKKQSLAESSGDDIRAIVRGTGANHDGFKEGITVPNSEAQARLLRQTYKDAGISTADTGYFEAHGTGTAAGDPREAKAIGSVFGPARNRPLMLGSIKSNVGHLEGASGVAGIIKATMSVEAGKILPNMHFNKPNPKIDFDELKLQVPTKIVDWKSTIRRASINSFGYGGSNAHVILENYTGASTRNSITRAYNRAMRPFLFPISAHSERAGNNTIERLQAYIKSNPETRMSDVAYSYSTRRSMHSVRSFRIGRDAESLLKDCGEPRDTETWTRNLDNKPRLGFVFTGQGAQWYAMGRQLIQESPLFNQTLARCDRVLQNLPDKPDWFCVAELLKSKEDSQLSRSLYSQPLCAALQLAIIELLTCWGISPSAVVGHSSGEIAAAYAAGILSFDDAMICAYYRGLYMSKGTGSARGAMMAVGMTEAEGLAALESYEGRISLAAINSPSSLTLSGDEDAIQELKDDLDKRKVFARKLQVEQAFHSHHMKPLAPGFKKALTNVPGFQPLAAKCKMFSSVTARDSSAWEMDASYWAANMTGMVKFSDALTGILLNDNDEANVDVLVEIGAHPALKGPSKQTMKTLDLNLPYIASLSRDDPAFESLLACAGQLFALGYPVDLAAVNSNHYLTYENRVMRDTIGQRLRDLPTYGWDHQSYWAETRLIKEHRQRQYRHSILGAPVPGGMPSQPRWRSYLRQSELPWLAHHCIDGQVIFPAAGYISMAIEAAVRLMPDRHNIKLQDIAIKSALALSSSETGNEVILDLQRQVSGSGDGDSWYRFSIYSFDETDSMSEHCSGLITTCEQTDRSFASFKGLDDLRKKSYRVVPVEVFYPKLHNIGLQYSDSFQLLAGDIEVGSGFAISQLSYDSTKTVRIPEDDCILHPTLLDAAFHPIFAALESQLGHRLGDAFIPTFIKSISVSPSLVNSRDSDIRNYFVYATAELPGTRQSLSDVTIADMSENAVVRIRGLQTTALGLDMGSNQDRSLFFRNRWLDAFQFLQSDRDNIFNLPDLFDYFVHQYPDARVLHITPSVDATIELLSKLSSALSASRRFQSIKVYCPSESHSAEETLLSKLPTRGLIDKEEISSKAYDLVIVQDNSELSVSELVKDDGYVIDSGIDFEKGELEISSQSGTFSISKFPAKSQYLSDVAFVVSGNPSKQTIDVISSVEKLRPGKLHRVSLDEATLLDNSVDIISLLSLDDDVLFTASSETKDYFNMQKFLSKRSGNVVWLLRGASQEPINPSQAMLLGLFRTIRNENDSIRLVSVDVPPAITEQSVSYILDTLNTSLLEDELVISNERLLIPRVEADDILNSKLPTGKQRKPAPEIASPSKSIVLKFGAASRISSLHFEEQIENSDLHEDEVEIDVMASALNDRDLAISLGKLDNKYVGNQCSGIIRRAGSRSGFVAGDRVAAWTFGKSAHTNVLRNPASATRPIASLDFKIAATLPYNWTIAYYMVRSAAHLEAGETCLIHGATKAVGQLATRLAQNSGAKVCVTYSTENERQYLEDVVRLPGSTAVSSANTALLDTVDKFTSGKGYDVVINASGTPCSETFWDCLSPFGRLVEYSNIPSSKSRDLQSSDGITHVVVDGAKFLLCKTQLASRSFKDSIEYARNNPTESTLPITEYSLARVQEAFSHLQREDNFDHIVLVASDEPVAMAPPTYKTRPLFKAEKTYLIVGGLGGIGQHLSRWMFSRGARNLAFLSRSGASTTSAKNALMWLKDREVRVFDIRGDVTSEKDVEDCIKTIGSDLIGIFHAAMVLRDVLFADMTLQQWQDCVYPKVRGAWNLHKATLDSSLDFFVGFSSFSALNGSIGQANYAAANSYIDALMHYRRSNGLTGFSMNVGMVSGIGFVSKDSSLETIMERNGWDPVNEDELFYQIEEALSAQTKVPQKDGYDQHQLITGINLARKDLFWARKPMFRNLYANLDLGASAAETSNARNLAADITSAKTAEAKQEVLLEGFIEKISDILSVDMSIIQPSNSLMTYGLDSIVASDFRRWFSKSVGVDLALFDIIGSKSIKGLVEKVVGLLANSTTAQAEDQTEQADKNQGQGLAASTGSVLSNLEKPQHIPMSTYQNRLWFLHNVVEDPATLNIGVTLLLDGLPKIEYMQKALHELAMRNEILRTSYFEGDEFAEQNVLSNFDTQTEFVDISSESVPRRALGSYAKSMRRTAIDLEGGEVIRSTLAKLDDNQYAWVFAFHHVMLDNGGTKSFLDQLTGLYEAFRQGTDISRVPAPRISYTDFTIWHNKELESSKEVQSDLEWWKQELAGTSGFSEILPFAKNGRPETPSRARHTIRSKIPPNVIKRMKRACARLDITPFQFLLTAFRAFIHRYTEEDDLTILMIDGNRPHSELDDVLGFFVNIVPLRCQNDCDGPFDALLKQVSKTVLDSMAHSRAPFDKIVESVKTNAGLHFPLGQIVFNYQMYGKAPQYKVSDFKLSDVIIDDIPTACEMSLEATEDHNSALDLRFEYDSYLYGVDEMERFLENFGTFLASATKDFRQPINEIYMCGPKEIQYLETNCWVSELSPDTWGSRSVWDRFVEICHTQANSMAIKTSEGDEISYETLRKKSESLACALRSAGASPGDKVAILAYPTIDTIAAMIASAYASCPYVALDPTFASGRIEYIIKDSNASVILTDAENKERAETMSSGDSKVLVMSEASKTSTYPLDNFYNPDDAFYMVYTSGSTGKPKGVVCTHEGTKTMLLAHNQVHKIARDDVMLAQISVSFDISVTQIWGSLTSGSCMALPTQDVRKDPVALARFIYDSESTVINFTPTQFALVLEQNRADLLRCSQLRTVIFIGEHLPPRLVEAVYDLGTPATVYNEYGPSEATAQNTIHRAQYPKDGEVYVPIGYALPNSSLHVVDPRLRPVPAQVSGELCIGGPQVASGYLNRPETTKDAFVNNPFTPTSFEDQGWTRLYRTGDKALFLHNGEVHCLGRISGDKQIKLRGYRIDQAEIENEIYAVSKDNDELALQEIAVLARNFDTSSEMGDERQIIAFVVTKDKKSSDELKSMITEIHRAIGHSLNNYMLPSGYQIMDAFPRLVSGKVDQVQLKTMELSLTYPRTATTNAISEEGMVEAENSTVAEIEKLFRTVLKFPAERKVEPSENFFDLGGQSVLLLRLQASINRKFNIKIPLPDLFENATTAGMSKLLSSRTDKNTGNDTDLPALNWPAEATLPNDPRYILQNGKKPPIKSNISGILLVGAESFTGVHLLYSFLAESNAQVYLLGSEKKLQQQDLFDAFEKWSLFDSKVSRRKFSSQVQFVNGSLAGTRFDLDEKSFNRLGQNVQAIYHAGGHVSLLKAYSSLKHLNVQSVLDTIELASLGTTATELHYISTWSVPHLQTWSNAKRTSPSVDHTERSPAHFQPGPGDNLGYFKTRWVAEMLMTEASKRGFPVYIYRSSGLSTSTRSKLPTPDDNFTINFVLGMIDAGKVPEINDTDGHPFSIDFAPIDYAASTISQLGRHAEAASNSPTIFHVGNPNPATLQDFVGFIPKLRKDGLQGYTVSVEEWTGAMMNMSTTEAQNLEWSMWREYLDLGHTMFSLDRSSTVAALRKIRSETTVECPPIGVEYLKELMERRVE